MLPPTMLLLPVTFGGRSHPLLLYMRSTARSGRPLAWDLLGLPARGGIMHGIVAHLLGGPGYLLWVPGCFLGLLALTGRGALGRGWNPLTLTVGQHSHPRRPYTRSLAWFSQLLLALTGPMGTFGNVRVWDCLDLLVRRPDLALFRCPPLLGHLSIRRLARIRSMLSSTRPRRRT